MTIIVAPDLWDSVVDECLFKGLNLLYDASQITRKAVCKIAVIDLIDDLEKIRNSFLEWSLGQMTVEQITIDSIMDIYKLATQCAICNCKSEYCNWQVCRKCQWKKGTKIKDLSQIWGHQFPVGTTFILKSNSLKIKFQYLRDNWIRINVRENTYFSISEKDYRYLLGVGLWYDTDAKQECNQPSFLFS